MSLIKNIALIGLAVSVFSSFGAFADDETIHPVVEGVKINTGNTGNTVTPAVAQTGTEKPGLGKSQ